jgi:hypothetical protein
MHERNAHEPSGTFSNRTYIFRIEPGFGIMPDFPMAGCLTDLTLMCFVNEK